MSAAIEEAMAASQLWILANLLPISRSQVPKSAGRTVSERCIDFCGESFKLISAAITASSTAFLTVTVTGAWDESISPPSPGDYDPSIAQHLAEIELDAWNKAAPGSPLRQDLASRKQFFTTQSMRMQTGGSSITWWGSNVRRPAS